MKRLFNVFVCAALLGVISVSAWAEIAPHCKRTYITSSIDGKSRHFYLCLANKKKSPLLVYLAAWSGGFPEWEPVIDGAKSRNWHVIASNGRGPNDTIDSIGSELAVQDVMDAINYSKSLSLVDTSRIYVLGASGGGYLALRLAAKHPDYFAGVSSWAAMTDLSAWHRERTKQADPNENYAKEMERAFGGPPSNIKAASFYIDRSPIFQAASLRNVNLDWNAGIKDGHFGSVYISHTLNMFDAIVANPQDRLLPKLKLALVENNRANIPKAKADPTYGDKPVLYRCTRGKVRLTIFDGAHEMVPEAGLAWLNLQSK